ncbi:hypothetical protein [Carboxylicivirga sp. M1479]|uniref:hypothetical protein n=1 Tax=Carboxylicivirga sp. M1479 TaxID=2594476 RepID=UPI0011784A23|nr:hypothetical protein [Carboxylicivirga sp. M1479]TRX71831.1 hypothetical protein FNN09_04215 [Carboxylicivirga sp. M1479]
MKKQARLYAFALLGLFSISLMSCDDDPEESCNKNEDDIGTCSADDITACCDDGGSCYFIYQGEEYSSATELANICKPGSAQQLKAFEIQLDDITMQLINEARSAAICQ